MTNLHSAGGATEKITVLHVILSLEIGGMEQVVADLVRGLDRNRFDPVVVCVESLGPIADELIASGYSVVLLPSMIPILSFLFPVPLFRIMRQKRASVVHAHSGCLYKTALAARLAGIREIIYTDHGRQFPESMVVALFDRIFSYLTSHVVAVSLELADYLHRVVGIPRDKITVVRNGIRVERFNMSLASTHGEDVVIGIIARLAPVKNISTLLHAMKRVVEECPYVKLRIVGDGPERRALEQLSVSLGIVGSVEFMGFQRQVHTILAGIDIFVLSSLSEGTSVTLLEAMAAGKPVVVTRVGGNLSLVEDERNGLLVSPGSPDELAESLMLLVRSPQMRKRFGELNRRKAMKEFSVDAMVQQYEVLYEGNISAAETDQ